MLIHELDLFKIHSIQDFRYLPPPPSSALPGTHAKTSSASVMAKGCSSLAEAAPRKPLAPSVVWSLKNPITATFLPEGEGNDLMVGKYYLMLNYRGYKIYSRDY